MDGEEREECYQESEEGLSFYIACGEGKVFQGGGMMAHCLEHLIKCGSAIFFDFDW